MEPLETAIRNHLVAYLAGQLSLDQFADWFVGASWDLDQVKTPNAYALAASIELALAEASGGLLSPAELQDDLLKLAAGEQTGVKIVHEVEIH